MVQLNFIRSLAVLYASLWFVFFFGNVSFADTTKKVEKVPTKITSDSMSYEQSNSRVTFTGNVKVEREDFDLWADTLSLEFAPQKENKQKDTELSSGGGEVKSIEAEGNVRFKSEGRSGECGKAVYTEKNGLLVLTESPVVREGANQIQGEKIKLFLRDGKSEVVGGKKRVEAIFYTPKSESKLR